MHRRHTHGAANPAVLRGRRAQRVRERRGVLTLRGPGSKAAHLTDLLLERSAEFRDLWAAHEVGVRPRELKRYDHPLVGRLELSCQVLLDPEQAHSLLVYTAVPGSESHEKLQLLSVVGPATAAQASGPP